MTYIIIGYHFSLYQRNELILFPGQVLELFQGLRNIVILLGYHHVLSYTFFTSKALHLDQ